MFQTNKYHKSCTNLLQFLKCGRGGIYIGGFDILGADVFGHQYIIDSRHSQSLKTLYIPPPIEASVLGLMMTLIKPGMLCVDIGSGCGCYSIIAASLIKPHGEIYSFEVIPECLALLEKNIELNEVESITCDKHVVSNGQKRISYPYFGENYQFFFLNSSDQKEKRIETETISLDQYFEDKEHSIDFVKINYEENITFIFEGMDFILKMNPKIMILSAFNKEKILKAQGDLDGFFENLQRKKLDIYLLPTLNRINKDQLLSFNTTKQILLARDFLCDH